VSVPPSEEPAVIEDDGTAVDSLPGIVAAAPEPATPRAAPTTELEVERKLRVPALFTMPPIAGPDTGVARVVARPPITLTATYLDTSDLRLARWGVTLRRREGGPDAGWHLKLPVLGANPGDRDEVRMPLESGAAEAPPAELTHIVTALVRGATVAPVATLRTERTPFLLRADDDRLIAELVDDVVSVLDGERVAGRFREIEVEARDADAHDLDRVLAVLVAAGAEPGTTSKAAHALGPRATAPPDVPAPVSGSPRDPASVAVHAHLVTQARRLLLNDVRMRRDLPDAVHQMRVAARRLRSSLRTFRPLLDAEWADGLREDLGWVASELGSVRDTEVLLKRLDAHCELIDDADAREAARREITTVLGDRLVTARADALAALNSPRYVALLEHVVTAVRVPPFTVDATAPAKVVLPALSWDAWRRLRRSASELDHDIAAEHWHRARIIAKRARYAAEAIEPVFGDDAAVLARSLEQVTELLGEHQDAAVAQAAIAELAARPGIDGRTGWGLGLLHGVERDTERQAREDFADVWANTERVHRRSRLR